MLLRKILPPAGLQHDQGNTLSRVSLITVDIRTGMIEGKFPKRALRHVFEWYEIHQEELQENWNRCGKREALNSIEPLE